MDTEVGLNAQIEHLQLKCNVPLENNMVLGYKVGTTGDGKGMRLANHSLDGKCLSCDDRDRLEPGEGDEQVRWGAFLRAIPPHRRVGDYTHAPKRGCKMMSTLGCKKGTVGE